MKVGLFVLFAVVLVVTAACSVPSSPAATPVQPLSSASTSRSGRFTMSLSIEAPGVDVTVTGSGAFDLDRQAAAYAIDLTPVGLDTMEVRAVDGVVYLREGRLAPQWVRGAKAAIDPAAVLAGVAGGGNTFDLGDGARADLTVTVVDGGPVEITAPPPEQVVGVGDMLGRDERTPH